MDKFIVHGGNPLHGEISIAGAKNVALKTICASLLTNEEVVLHNVPMISDVKIMLELLEHIGSTVNIKDHDVYIKTNIKNTNIPLEVGARLRTSSMLMAPLLARTGTATVPNPGGCRLGARPIDRHIQGLKDMGADISYHSDDGYFHAHTRGLAGTSIRFLKNTHTGTETIILAAVLARGKTVIKNAAAEIEIDDLIALLNSMGADIKRTAPRIIEINGVDKLHGAEHSTMPDRNEEVTFAIAAMVTGGDVIVRNSQPQAIAAFWDKLKQAGGGYEAMDNKTTRYFSVPVTPTDVITAPYPVIFIA